MTRLLLPFSFLFLALSWLCLAQEAPPAPLKVWTTPASHPVAPQPPKFVAVLLGGHGDVDAALKIFCRASGGGPIVVLTASGGDEMNSYLHKLCPQNSVTSFQIASLQAARDPRVVEALRSAHAIYITGGDQSNYVKFWPDTPTLDQINAALSRGIPVAGMSAGLAVLGEYSFSSLIDTVTSPEALANPYDPKITLERQFLEIPLLRGILTDSHFSQRRRLGRTIAFLSRLSEDGWTTLPRAIGVDETTAVVVDSSGIARVLGKNSASFISLTSRPEQCAPHKPLTVRGVEIYKIPAGAAGSFDLRSWTGRGGSASRLDVIDGVLHPSS